MEKKNIGSSFDSWLGDEAIREEVIAAAIKRVLARQVEAAMKEKNFSKSEMARNDAHEQAPLDHLLNPEYEAVTLSTLRKAAKAAVANCAGNCVKNRRQRVSAASTLTPYVGAGRARVGPLPIRFGRLAPDSFPPPHSPPPEPSIPTTPRTPISSSRDSSKNTSAPTRRSAGADPLEDIHAGRKHPATPCIARPAPCRNNRAFVRSPRKSLRRRAALGDGRSVSVYALVFPGSHARAWRSRSRAR